jgi:hypothetical protein
MQCNAVQYSNSVMLYNLIRLTSSTIQCHTIQCNTIQYNTMQNNIIQCNTIQYNTEQYNGMQYNTILYYTMLYNATQHNIIQYDTIHYNATLFLTFANLFYSIIILLSLRFQQFSCLFLAFLRSFLAFF